MPKGYRRNVICLGCKAKREKTAPLPHTMSCRATKLKYDLSFYNLTAEQFVRMYTEQEGRCRICQIALGGIMLKKLNIDHDHRTGRVRGLICRSCNMGLGNFKDNLQLLRSAVRYLEETAS
jgi:Recombination endonuclease VII